MSHHPGHESTAAITIPTKQLSGGSGLSSPASLTSSNYHHSPDGILLSQIKSVEQLSQSFTRIEAISMAGKEHLTKNVADAEVAVKSKLKTDAKNYVLRSGGNASDTPSDDSSPNTGAAETQTEELKRVSTEESNFNKNFSEKDYSSKCLFNNTSPTSNESLTNNWQAGVDATTPSDYMTLDKQEFVMRQIATTITTTVDQKPIVTPSVAIPPTANTWSPSMVYYQHTVTSSSTPTTAQPASINSETFIYSLPLKHKHPQQSCDTMPHPVAGDADNDANADDDDDNDDNNDDHLLNENNFTAGCQSCFHPTCAQFAASHSCHHHPEVYKHKQNLQTYSSELPITQWTPKHVIEWMAALNLDAYIELFKSKLVNGSDLLNLDRDKIVELGVKDDFHKDAILKAVDELLKTQKSTEPIFGVSDSCVDARDEPSSAAQKLQHNLIKHSFSQMEMCQYCEKYFHGLIHQGFICKNCQYKVHRTCLAVEEGLTSGGGHKMPCTPHVTGDTDDVSLPPPAAFANTTKFTIFGLPLEEQFDVAVQKAPAIVLLCCQEIERRCKKKPINSANTNVYQLYRSAATAECLELRNRMVENINQCRLADYSVQCIANVLKKYFRELPNPVIPFAMYPAFIDATKSTSNERAIHNIAELVKALPEHNRSVLTYMMEHMIRLCHLQQTIHGSKERPTKMVQVWSSVFLRPPWEQAIEIVYNTEHHIHCLEILFFSCSWSELLPRFQDIPVLPPRPSNRLGTPIVAPSTSLSGMGEMVGNTYSNSPLVQTTPIVVCTAQSADLLKEADWYWGSITREDVKEKLQDAVDGSFMVRDATNVKGEYTLTVKKDATDRVIRIYHKNGLYGFTHDSCNFESVLALINYYKKNSLRQHNQILDIRLLHAISRSCHEEEFKRCASDVNQLVANFVATHTEYAAKTKEFEQISDDHQKNENELQVKKHALEMFREAEAIFEEQIKVQTLYAVDAHPHELIGITENAALLNERLHSLCECKRQLKTDMERQKILYKGLDREVNSKRSELLHMMRQLDTYRSYMLSQGITESTIKKIKEGGIGEWKPQEQTERKLEAHHDKNNWYFEDYSRVQAEDYLKKKPDGTFLIRKRSDNPDQHVLSINCKDSTNHCIIFRTERGYGFAEPYNIYESLEALVLHYATNSLEEHNDLLQTTLKYPVKCSSEQISQSQLNNLNTSSPSSTSRRT